MRTRAINERMSKTRRLNATATADAKELAQRLNAAAKPAGFPTTRERGRARERHHTIPEGTAITAALALVLDMLDGGVLTPVDLLCRIKTLHDTDPTEADRRDKVRRGAAEKVSIRKPAVAMALRDRRAKKADKG